MKVIAAISVLAIILLQASGAVPQSSVGGPLTLAVVFFAAMLAVGIHEAWSKRRGVLGWIVNLPVSLIGGFLAAEVGNMAFVVLLIVAEFTGLLGLLNLGGSTFAEAGGLPLYVGLAAMMLLVLLGSWTALQIVNRWR